MPDWTWRTDFCTVPAFQYPGEPCFGTITYADGTKFSNFGVIVWVPRGDMRYPVFDCR